jgi:hypothetical protein
MTIETIVDRSLTDRISSATSACSALSEHCVIISRSVTKISLHREIVPDVAYIGLQFSEQVISVIWVIEYTVSALEFI